ncbi:MAG: hypothetical protein EBW38_10945, partial [Rhodobacteraceae bacterium]|nr:hypothetical protein [Paracoccaceae bacterium]
MIFGSFLMLFYFGLFGAITTLDASSNFKLVVSSSAGTGFGNDDGFAGVRIFTASLNPSSPSYIANFLNTNPELFESEKHYLQAD